MKLNFVNNAAQRLATKRSIPTPQLEAVIEYGAPAKRAQAVKKVIEAAPTLTQHKETHQLILTLTNAVDSTKRCELLYALRRKIKDMCGNRFGNIVLQRLIETLPPTQVREIAEDLREEACDIARHPFGNRVIQKLAAHTEGGDIIASAIRDDFAMLAQHATAQHAVASLVANVAGDLTSLCDETLVASLVAMPESAVLTALASSPRVPEDLQTRCHAAILDKLENLISEGHQHFAIVAAIETVNPEALNAWSSVIAPNAREMCKAKGMCAVLAALVRRLSGKPREQLVVAALQAFDDAKEAACHPYGSIVLREALCPGNVALPKKMLSQLAAAAAELVSNPTGVVVAQRLVMLRDSHSKNVVQVVQSQLNQLAPHPAGTHAVQAALDHTDDQELVQAMAAGILEGTLELCRDQHGTFAVQKALAVANEAAIASVCSLLETHAKELAFDPKASFTVAAVLLAAKRLGLKDSLKVVMDQLKPEVTRLATKPWVGKVVLDAMFQVASPALKDAIRDVIFLKCEMFLSHVPDGAAAPQRRSRSASTDARPKRHFKEARE